MPPRLPETPRDQSSRQAAKLGSYARGEGRQGGYGGRGGMLGRGHGLTRVRGIRRYRPSDVLQPAQNYGGAVPQPVASSYTWVSQPLVTQVYSHMVGVSRLPVLR